MTKNNIRKRPNKSLILSTGKYKNILARRYAPGGLMDYNGPEKGLGWGQASREAATEAFSAKNVGGTVSGILGGVGELATGAIDLYNKTSQIDTAEDEKAQMEEVASLDFSGATDNSSLLSSYNDMQLADIGYNWKDFTQSGGQQAGNIITGTLQGIAQGANAGKSLGPWGLVGGAAAGFLSSLGAGLGELFTGNKKAEEQAAKMNAYAEEVNTRATNSFNSQAEKLRTADFNNRMANITKDGGKIHIKPSKRGTFTAAAKKHGKSVQAFASQVLANKENYSPAMVKKANFARNASKWKHSLGGFLYGEGGNLYSNVPNSQTHGTDFSNGMTLINRGGTHEQNPFEGVQMGVDLQGIPNLVEEGEVIFNDYVFSNRLHPSEKELEKANLPKRYKGHTFALIAEDMGKESSERPNDPISRRGLEDSMMKLAMIQEAQRARKGKKGTQKLMAYGGRKYADGTQLFNDAQKNIYDSIMSASDSLDFSMDLPKQEISLREPDPYFVPYVRKNGTMRNRGVWVDPRGNIEGRRSANPHDAVETLPTWMRYSPVVGSLANSIYSLIQKPDYENADIVMNEAENLSRPSVRYRALNNYMTYRPLDRNYYLNQLKGQAGATRRAIANSTGNAGTAMAGLLAADYNAQNAVGNTLMQMEQYNDAQRQRIAEFNRGTDMANSQGFMQADQANAQIAQNRDRLRSTLMTQAAHMREASDAALEASRSANITNFLDNIGSIGRENMGWNWTKYLADSGAFGNLREGYPAPGMGKNGGLLTKRNRRRR